MCPSAGVGEASVPHALTDTLGSMSMGDVYEDTLLISFLVL